MPALQLAGVSKDYRVGFWRKRSRVLHDLDLTVEPGETFGYLGPNGAGKSTTIKILLGLVRPTAGAVRLFDRPASDPSVRAAVGFLPESPAFYDYLTGQEFLRYAGRLAGLARAEASEQVARLLDRVGLAAAGGTHLRKYSKGMLQRIGLAHALLGDPRLIILDEPMSGLDPIGRKEVRDIILRLRAEGRTVFFSSHIIPDVEMLCDRVGILLGGRLVRVGRLDELLGSDAEFGEVTVTGLPAPVVAELAPLALAPPLTQGAQTQFRVQGDAEVERILRRSLEAGGHVQGVVFQRRTLEELFLAAVQGGGRP
jgi:ABC-2 type transport system ATP-binding protein